ncbi:FtsX-like permease family protein [Corynebacterium sp.]|uniref:ABC transporter permease n=1 Tax=Corynebacterium sp. TaxID=1720 RepID=UPI0026DD64B9|nr:FtsX-like permease family protein [Corynebacterium sp.]MDO5032684.1 hypothetical protein [Corynebacterium sp.]
MSHLTALAAATRPTRRELRTSPKSLFLILLLIAIPAALIAGAGLWYHADNYARSLSAPLRTITVQQEHSTEGAARDFADVLPEGLSATPILNATGTSLSLPDGTSRTLNSATQFDAQHPPAEAEEILRSFDLHPGDVLLPRKLARELNLRTGDTVTVHSRFSEASKATIAGTIPGDVVVATAPVIASSDFLHENPRLATWSLVGNTALDQATIDAAQRQGIEIWDGQIADSSLPSDGEAWSYAFGLIAASLLAYSVIIILVLAVLSPVFTLAAGRHSRLYALMASQGAQPRHIIAAVTAYGFLLGLLGATVGVLSGVALSYLVWHILFPAVHPVIPWAWAGWCWLVIVVLSTLLAFGPAVLAARRALSASMAGAGQGHILRWRAWMAIGPLLLIVVACLSFTDVGYSAATYGAPFWLLALAASTPALVVGVAQLAARGPLPVRLAGRQLGRQGTKSVSLALALLMGSFALTTWYSVLSTDNARWRAEELAVGSDSAALLRPYFEDEWGTDVHSWENEASQAALGIVAGAAYPLDAFPDVRYSPEVPESTESYELETEFDFQCTQQGDAAVERAEFIDMHGRSTKDSPEARAECAHEMLTSFSAHPLLSESHMVQVSASELGPWSFPTEEDRQAAARTLREGGIVLAHNSHLHGKTSGSVTAHRYVGPNATPKGSTTKTLPITEAMSTLARDTILISPEAARELGMKAEHVGTILDFAHRPTRAERALLDDAISLHSQAMLSAIYASYDDGDMDFLPGVGLGLVSLALLSLLMAYQAHTTRRDELVLYSVGANPSLLRSAAAWQTWLVGFSALLAGVLVGHAAAFLLTAPPVELFQPARPGLSNRDYFSFDWWLFGAALVAPILAAGISWLTSPARKEDNIADLRHGESRALV